MHPLTDLNVGKDTVVIHWFEQSTFALRDSSGTVVQIDPYFPRERPPEQFIHAKAPLDESRLRTDAVLLTHAHGDHTCTESILRIHANFKNVKYIMTWEWKVVMKLVKSIVKIIFLIHFFFVKII